MIDFQKAFDGHEVPENIRRTSENVCIRFDINGICDPMYICNVIAVESKSGDGCSHFTSSKISNHHIIAERLQRSYGCNIKPSEINELEAILRNNPVVTRKQWQTICDDYKIMIDGKPHCFLGCLQSGGGTILTEVFIR